MWDILVSDDKIGMKTESKKWTYEEIMHFKQMKFVLFISDEKYIVKKQVVNKITQANNGSGTIAEWFSTVNSS